METNVEDVWGEVVHYDLLLATVETPEGIKFAQERKDYWVGILATLEAGNGE